MNSSDFLLEVHKSCRATRLSAANQTIYGLAIRQVQAMCYSEKYANCVRIILG